MINKKQLDLKYLDNIIASIRSVVRRQVRLPNAINAIRQIKRKENRAADSTIQKQSKEERIKRIKNASKNIRSQWQRERLPSIIQQIKHKINHEFETEDKTKYQTLLAALNGTGVPLASLSICGQGTREIRYTQLLRYFLDPNELHGIGPKVIIEILGPEFRRLGYQLEKIEWENAKVNAEFDLGKIVYGKFAVGCTVDLLLQFDKYIVMIENKIKSSESGIVSSGEISQLRRYSKAFELNFPKLSSQNIVKIYLTPDRRSPRDDREWLPLSYSDIINRTISLISDDSLSKIGRHNLCCFLWDLISGPLYLEKSVIAHLKDLIKEAIEFPEKHIRLKKWCRENVPFVDDILEIVRVCYV
jgi:hypothetical protein